MGLQVLFQKFIRQALQVKWFHLLTLLILLTAVANGISYMLFQLIGAVKLPATVLYPLITGGTIILSSLADFLIYKEKLSLKQWSGVGIAFLGTLMFL